MPMIRIIFLISWMLLRSTGRILIWGLIHPVPSMSNSLLLQMLSRMNRPRLMRRISYARHSIYVCCDYRIYPMLVELIEKTGYKIKHCIVWKKNIFGLGKRYRFQHKFIIYACYEKSPFYGGRDQSDIWEISSDKSIDHNTLKPVGLPSIAINNSSIVGNIILDLFLGSGTTLISCEQLQRVCYGVELSVTYCDVIIKRYIQFT